MLSIHVVLQMNCQLWWNGP